VIITVRSRSRVLRLVTPSDEAVTELLVTRDGIAPALAAHSARAAQGHVGRARMLARNEEARIRRREVLALPGRLTSVTACLDAAQNLVESSGLEAAQATAELDAKELTALQEALGLGGRGAKPRNAQAAVRDLEDQQKARVKRLQRDALDRVLTELTGYYRDVLAMQTASGVPLVNSDLADEIEPIARRTRPEQTVHALDAILRARTALEGNVAPLLALESLLIALSLAGRS